MSELERRFVEVRTDGRTVSGVAVPYGEVTTLPGFRERFAAGAFGADVAGGDVRLDLQHRRERLLARTGAGLTLTDGAAQLRFSALLPAIRDADDALTMLRAGLLRGASVEFRAITDEWADDLRTIVRARLVAIGLVDSPQYAGAVAEARAKLADHSPATSDDSRPLTDVERRRYWCLLL